MEGTTQVLPSETFEGLVRVGQKLSHNGQNSRQKKLFHGGLSFQHELVLGPGRQPSMSARWDWRGSHREQAGRVGPGARPYRLHAGLREVGLIVYTEASKFHLWKTR